MALDRRTRTIAFDHLLIAAGSQTRFPPGLRPHVHGMKTIHDALVLRNWLIGLLERAEIEEDPARRRALLTIAVAGGGFSGVETIGAINDFLHEVARHYRRASAELPTLVLVESNGAAAAGIRAGARRIHGVQAARTQASTCGCVRRWRPSTGAVLSLDVAGDATTPLPLAARTLIWTAGVAPSPLIESLSLAEGEGPDRSSTTRMAVPGHEGVWACGDCAAVPGPARQALPHHRPACGASGRAGGPQHRGGRARPSPRRSARSATRCSASSPRSGASVRWPRCSACRFSGFIAWLMWRGAYLSMLPRLDRKVRVFLQWTLEICFARDTVQLLTVESVRAGRIEELMDSARAAESADWAPQP